MTNPGNTSEDTAIFVHIPKTAGISLREFVIQTYGKEHTWLYAATTNHFIRADKMLFQPHETDQLRIRILKHRLCTPITKGLLALNSRQANDAGQVYTKANAIIGHFPHDIFDDLPNYRPIRRFTVMRDPLARTVSHYRYLQSYRNFSKHLLGWMNGCDPTLSFEEFALSESVKNFQTCYMGTDINRYERIGTTENLKDFLVKTGMMSTDADLPHYNRTICQISTPTIVDDAGFVRDFKQFHSTDYAVYNQVLSKFKY